MMERLLRYWDWMGSGDCSGGSNSDLACQDNILL